MKRKPSGPPPLFAPAWTPSVTAEQEDAHKNYLWALSMKFRERRNHFWKLLRLATLERDGWRCTYCGKAGDSRTLEVDHDAPRARGGGDHPRNLRAACRACNRRKRVRTGSSMRHLLEKETLARRLARLPRRKRKPE